MDPELLQFHQNLISDVVSTNAQYLGISIAVISVVVGIYYVFNISPLKKKIEKQEEEIKRARENAVNQASDIQAAKEEVERLSGKLEEDISRANDDLNNKVNSLEAEVYESIALKSRLSLHDDNLPAIIFAVKGVLAAERSGVRDSLHSPLSLLIEVLNDTDGSEKVMNESLKDVLVDRLDQLETDDPGIKEKLEKAKNLLTQLNKESV